jgi:ribonuclease HII
MSKRKKKAPGLSPKQRDALRLIEVSKAEYIIGIDEVGVGSWAGPLVVAGVVLPKGWAHAEVKDSKAFGSKKSMMRVLLDVVYPAVLARCLLSHPSHTVDEMGVEKSQRLLTESVALFLRERFPDALVVQDGGPAIPIDGSLRGVISLPEADGYVPAVSAASILAKVSRDLFMREQSKVYPEYGFETNAGYHSLKHKLALKEYGPTPLHRRSFSPVRRIMADREALSALPSVPLTATLAELVNS